MSILTCLSEDDLPALVRRLSLSSVLLRRKVEEEIACIVPSSLLPLDQAEIELLDGQSRNEWILSKGLTEGDFLINLKLPLALQEFARQSFSPGLEEAFLSNGAAKDTVIYSLLRVHDSGLLREIYLRITEGEMSFPDAACQYGEGPEAKHQGVIGPLELGSIQPQQIPTWLRSLKPGEVLRPQSLGDWHILLRLEHFYASRLDDSMRNILLNEQLDKFLNERVQSMQNGQPVPPLTFHTDMSS